jgi:protein-tyrosine phosphatase
VIDTHCHLLPGLDDGPASEADCVRLARALSEEGVTRVLCTPHYSRRYPTALQAARDRLARIRYDLAAVGVALRLDLAAEVSPELALRAPIAELAPRAVAGRFLLVELVSRLPPGIPSAIAERLAAEGLEPVFAHPERWLAGRGRVDLLDDLRSRGAWLQVVVPSLVGSSSPEIWETAWELVTTGRADLVGSDAHRAGGRRVQLRGLADLLDARCGEERREELLEGGPARLLAGLPRPELAASGDAG